MPYFFNSSVWCCTFLAMGLVRKCSSTVGTHRTIVKGVTTNFLLMLCEVRPSSDTLLHAVDGTVHPHLSIPFAQMVEQGILVTEMSG